MNILVAFFIVLAGLLTIPSDLKKHKIFNRDILLVVVPFIASAIIFTVSAKYTIPLSGLVINVTVSLIVSYILFHFKIWRGGDAHLYILYTFLLSFTFSSVMSMYISLFFLLHTLAISFMAMMAEALFGRVKESKNLLSLIKDSALLFFKNIELLFVSMFASVLISSALTRLPAPLPVMAKFLIVIFIILIVFKARTGISRRSFWLVASLVVILLCLFDKGNLTLLARLKPFSVLAYWTAFAVIQAVGKDMGVEENKKRHPMAIYMFISAFLLILKPYTLWLAKTI